MVRQSSVRVRENQVCGVRESSYSHLAHCWLNCAMETEQKVRECCVVLHSSRANARLSSWAEAPLGLPRASHARDRRATSKGEILDCCKVSIYQLIKRF